MSREIDRRPQGDPKLVDSLRNQLETEGFDLVDLIAIPSRGDRMVRIRTLEEALDDFDRTESPDLSSFLVQVRARRPKNAAGSQATGYSTGYSENASDIDDTLNFDTLVDETFDRAARAPVGPNAATGATAAGTPRPAPAAPNGDGLYLASGKTNVPFLLKNAELLFGAGEFALARNIYKAVLASGERSSIAHFWLGRTYEAESQFAEAQNHYEQSLTYQATIEAYQRFAALLIRQKKDQQAAELMERAANLRELSNPIRFEVHRAAGNCWMRCERPAEAEQNYLKALQCEPRSDAILSNLGSLSLQRGDTGKARKYFQDAVALQPRNEKALAGLGSCHVAEGDARQGHDCFARALEIQINNPTAIFHLVKCAYELKSYATAERLVAEYVQSAPVNTHLLYSLAGLQFHLGKITEAKSSANRILGLQPEHAGAKELLKLTEKY